MYRYPWLQIGENAYVDEEVITKKDGALTMIGWGCYVGKDVELGEGVIIGPGVIIIASSHGIIRRKLIRDQKCISKKIIIEDHVWIGAGAVILGGNTIKSGAVIGAGSVLTEDHIVGEKEVWCGNPCHFLKNRE